MAFIRRRWSLGETFWLAAGIGFVLPFSGKLFVEWMPWHAVPFVVSSLLAVLVAVLYSRIERGQFRKDCKAMLAMSGAGLLWAAGAIGSGWCFNHHVCVGGHMAHGPYPSWHYALDVCWAAAVLLAASCMRLARVSIFVAFTVLAAYLVSYRFLFGSMGGMYPWIPL